MKVKYLVFVPIIALPLFLAETAALQTKTAEPTLWGIYGAHNRHDCPVNNLETAKEVIALSKKDLKPVMEKHGVIGFVDQYHSGLEHTLLWAVETTRPHDLEEFCIDLGLARWNDLKFVPLRTFGDVLRDITAIHKLEDWIPEEEK
ncbi:MAG: hypothetical protein O7H41_09410 [Planctomycetota bacterium]|nr:hypothetical protein [Planctomycetota bacterium]